MRTKKPIAEHYRLSEEEILSLIAQSDNRDSRKLWYKPIEKEFVRRGAPADEKTAAKAKTLVGRIANNHPEFEASLKPVQSTEIRQKDRQVRKWNKKMKARRIALKVGSQWSVEMNQGEQAATNQIDQA